MECQVQFKDLYLGRKTVCLECDQLMAASMIIQPEEPSNQPSSASGQPDNGEQSKLGDDFVCVEAPETNSRRRRENWVSLCLGTRSDVGKLSFRDFFGFWSY